MCVTSSTAITHHELAISYPLLHSSIPIRCVVDSVVTLLLQLDGEEAVTALHTIMECVPLCVTAHEEGMEDGKMMECLIAALQSPIVKQNATAQQLRQWLTSR